MPMSPAASTRPRTPSPGFSLRAFGALLALSFGVTALAGAARAQSEADRIAAARKDGRVVFYTSFVSPALHAAVARNFEKKYGIPVDVLNPRASELEERLRTEQAAGRFLADVVQHGQASITRLFRAGVVQKLDRTPNMANMIDGQPAEEHEVGSLIAGYGVMVNTNLVKPGDEPKSWRDLLNPRWKGKILSDDMRALGGGLVMFSAIMKEPTLGEAFHRQLAQQDLVFTRDVGASERRVARGEYPIWIPQISVNVLGLRGLPLKFITPREGVGYVRLDLGLLKNPPHRAAAQLFIDYYLSDENQMLVGSMGLIPVVKGVMDKIPADKRVMETVKLMGTIDVDTQTTYLNLAKDIYK